MEDVGALGVRPENIPHPNLLKEGEEDNNDKRTGLQVKTSKKEAMKRVRLIGLVTSVRQVQTKTGKMMAIATCDSFDFKFTVLVFSKEYEALSPLLEEDKILLVEGIFRGNEENGEMAVTAQTIRASTITSIRQQAYDVNLFNPKAFVNLSGYTEEQSTSETEDGKKNKTPEMKKNISMETDLQETEDDAIEKMIEKTPQESEEKEEFTIKIPSSACRQDLVDLKTYLE